MPISARLLRMSVKPWLIHYSKPRASLAIEFVHWHEASGGILPSWHFLMHGSCLLVIYLQDFFPPAQFIIRVLFLFTEFISGCAKWGSGAGPGSWQHTTRLASKCQVGVSHPAQEGPFSQLPEELAQNLLNQSKPVVPGQHPAPAETGWQMPDAKGRAHLHCQWGCRKAARPVSITGKIHPSSESLPGRLCRYWCINL